MFRQEGALVLGEKKEYENHHPGVASESPTHVRTEEATAQWRMQATAQSLSRHAAFSKPFGLLLEGLRLGYRHCTN